MALTLPTDVKDREFNKFVEDGSGNVALRTAITVEDIEIGAVEIKDGTTDTRASVDSNNALKIFDSVANSLVPSSYDYIGLSYTGSNLTGVVFKTGGATGTLVSTLTLAYDISDNLISVTKT